MSAISLAQYWIYQITFIHHLEHLLVCILTAHMSVLLLAHSCCYWPESHPLMGLSSWVNVVRGKMVAIDRSVNSVCNVALSPDSRLTSLGPPPTGLSSVWWWRVTLGRVGECTTTSLCCALEHSSTLQGRRRRKRRRRKRRTRSPAISLPLTMSPRQQPCWIG